MFFQWHAVGTTISLPSAPNRFFFKVMCLPETASHTPRVAFEIHQDFDRSLLPEVWLSPMELPVGERGCQSQRIE